MWIHFPWTLETFGFFGNLEYPFPLGHGTHTWLWEGVEESYRGSAKPLRNLNLDSTIDRTLLSVTSLLHLKSIDGFQLS